MNIMAYYLTKYYTFTFKYDTRYSISIQCISIVIINNENDISV